METVDVKVSLIVEKSEESDTPAKSPPVVSLRAQDEIGITQEIEQRHLLIY